MMAGMVAFLAGAVADNFGAAAAIEILRGTESQVALKLLDLEKAH